MLLSCIIPCYDEAENIRPFFQAAEQALAPWDRQYELIFVDDGSRDETLQELEKLYRRAPDRVRVVSFSRNFGMVAAIYAGLHQCAGDYVALIDADLQQRPDYIAQMLTFLEEHPEYDEVVAYQERRNESRLLVLCKGLFYKIIRRLTGLPFAADASDFRVFRRNVLEAILSLPERGRFSKGIFAWIGFPTYRMPYQVEERANGASKWSLGKLFGYAMEGITAFSTKLLLLPLIAGVILAVGAVLLAVVLKILSVAGALSVTGVGWLAMLLVFLAGVQLQGLGVAAFYLGKLFNEGKGRPVYIERVVLPGGGEGK